MVSYIIRRTLQIIPVIIGITLIAFLVFYFAPGDPVDMMVGEGGGAEVRDRIREELGLDLPAHIQYFRFLSNALQGDLGISFQSRLPVTRMLIPPIIRTIQLSIASLLLMIVIGIPIGIFAAIFSHSFWDYFSMSISLVGISAPVFWTGIIFIYIFALRLGWFPTGGATARFAIVLPAVTQGLHHGAMVARMTRTSMLEVLNNDYIRTARSKGVKEFNVNLKHALKNASLPIITLVGLQFGTILGGVVLTETVFSWPGLGRAMVRAIFQRDHAVAAAGILIFSFSFSLINLLVDLSYVYLDPTVKYD